MNDDSESTTPVDLVRRTPNVQEMSPKDLFTAAAAGYSMDYAPEGEMHLRDYWRSVRSHLWLILGITAIITSLVAVFMARKPDIYQANARIQVDADTNPASGAFKSNQ